MIDEKCTGEEGRSLVQISSNIYIYIFFRNFAGVGEDAEESCVRTAHTARPFPPAYIGVWCNPVPTGSTRKMPTRDTEETCFPRPLEMLHTDSTVQCTFSRVDGAFRIMKDMTAVPVRVAIGKRRGLVVSREYMWKHDTNRGAHETL